MVRLLALAGMVVGLSQLPASSIPSPWEGVPEVPPSAQWFGLQGNGMSEVARAKQWMILSSQAVAVANHLESADYPPDDPEQRHYSYTHRPRVFLSSPVDGEKGYGEGIPVTVRTVGFGALPVEARVQVVQTRDENDLPLPFVGEATETRYRVPQQVRPGVLSTLRLDSLHLTGSVTVRVLSVAIDGTDLELSGRCESGPIELDLQGESTWEDDPLTDYRMAAPPVALGTGSATWNAERGIGTPGHGGAVSGLVEVPPFRNCTVASGEDLSTLLTGALSGPGNGVTVGFAPISGFKCSTPVPPYNFPGPRAPFSGEPTDCDPDFRPPEFSYPAP